MNHEESEWFSTTMESERAKMVEKIECDECGAKLPAIYDEGKLKVDCYHSCDIEEQTAAKARTSEIGKHIISTINAINMAYLEGVNYE